MKALILAGGRGTRLGALTDNLPKPMLPIHGIPMLEHIMAGIAREANLSEFVLVTGYRADVIHDYFADGSRWGWSIQYAHQESPRGVGDAVHCARSFLFDAPFLMTYGDIFLDAVNYRRFRDFGEEAILVGLNWVEDPWRGAAVYLDEAGAVTRIEEKPAPGTATTHWNNAGLFLFPPSIFHYTGQLKPSGRGELELPEAMTAMIMHGCRAVGLELTGEWRDVGTPEDYAAVISQCSP